MPVSPTSVPLKRRLRQAVPETVWFMPPSAVPAMACMPTNRAASQPCSRNPVYSVHSCWTTNSQSGSSWSGISELNVHAPPAPWQSMTTISVAPPARAPRTAALISSVYSLRPSSYSECPPSVCCQLVIPATPSMSLMMKTRIGSLKGFAAPAGLSSAG